jgi:hypothetical protein
MADRAAATPSNNGRRTNGPDAKTTWGEGEFSFIERGPVVREPDTAKNYGTVNTKTDGGK